MYANSRTPSHTPSHTPCTHTPQTDFLVRYTEYVSNYNTAFNTLNNALASEPKFKQFIHVSKARSCTSLSTHLSHSHSLQKCEMAPECRLSDLHSFLLEPIQRIPRQFFPVLQCPYTRVPWHTHIHTHRTIILYYILYYIFYFYTPIHLVVHTTYIRTPTHAQPTPKLPRLTSIHTGYEMLLKNMFQNTHHMHADYDRCV